LEKRKINMVGAGFYNEATPTEFGIGAAQIGFGSKPNPSANAVWASGCDLGVTGPEWLRFR
jgi:hypothetical protein